MNAPRKTSDEVSFMPPSAHDINDKETLIYLGDLLVQVEAALADPVYDAASALALLIFNITPLDKGVWVSRIDGVVIDGIDIGNWVISIRSRKTSAVRTISIERRSTLCEEGRVLRDVALALEAGKGPEGSSKLHNLISFCVMRTICLSLSEKRSHWVVQDKNGCLFKISVKKKLGVRKNISNVFNMLKKYSRIFQN